MTLKDFLQKLENDAELDFEATLQVIANNYTYKPAGFKNGGLYNEAGQNEGSCKIFAFAKINNLNEEQTLRCFGRFYQDVLANPQGSDHGNIRNFMQNGWSGIEFDTEALV